MYYNTSDICHLGEGYFCMKVNGESVAVVGGKVVADSSVKPTRFYIKKFQSGDNCSYVIDDASKSNFAEYNDKWTIYMTDSGPARNWTITWLRDNVYNIQPGPPSRNAWTAPYGEAGQIYLDTLQPGLPEQEFIITPC